MEILISVVGALIPSILLLRYFYRSDRYPEPGRLLRGTFLWGIAIAAPAVILALALGVYEDSVVNPLLFGLYSAFFGAAIPEELFKFLVVTRYSARHPEFNEAMDGVVYGATASLGFATLENLLYSFGDLGTALLRALTAVPGHAFLGAILGYYVGQSRFGLGRRPSAWLGLVVAIILHGLYDFPLLAIGKLSNQGGEISDTNALLILALVVFVLAVLFIEAVWAVRLVRRLRREQEQRLAAGDGLPT